MQITQLSRDEIHIPGDTMRHVMTPYFMYESVYNETKSRNEGKAVFDLKELVEIRFASNPQYRPKFGVEEMSGMDDNGRIITWAEKFAPQYQAFLAGAAQEAEGTPLEELLAYGMSQAQLSMCRAVSIYSIEALAHTEGAALKRLGQLGNDIKPMAKRYMENRRDGSQSQNEINELRRQLDELRGSTAAPVAAEDDEGENESDPYAQLSDSEIKDLIKDKTGTRPQGNPSRATLLSFLRDL